jgi:hypothetical protein
MSDYEYEHDPLNEAFTEDDDENYLPLGHHLLPQEYKDFIVKWHREVEEKVGNWTTHKKEYALKYPVENAIFQKENNRLLVVYAAEVEALKQYQKDHPEEWE